MANGAVVQQVVRQRQHLGLRRGVERLILDAGQVILEIAHALIASNKHELAVPQCPREDGEGLQRRPRTLLVLQYTVGIHRLQDSTDTRRAELPVDHSSVVTPMVFVHPLAQQELRYVALRVAVRLHASDDRRHQLLGRRVIRQ